MRGLLADNRRFGQQCGQALGEDRLGFVIGNGNDVVRRLAVTSMFRLRGERRDIAAGSARRKIRERRSRIAASSTVAGSACGSSSAAVIRVDRDVAVGQVAGPHRGAAGRPGPRSTSIVISRPLRCAATGASS
jgi:hypothetical protein